MPLEITQGRVLVVDDQSTHRLKMTLAVKALGYQAEATESGSLALQLLNEGHFDLVLLDIVMPDMDGFEVLTRMKAHQHLKDIPVIVISSLDDDMQSVVRAIELGAEDFLPKAFDKVLLRARIRTCIEKKQHRDQELDYLKQVEVLADAALVLDSGKFHPQKLKLEGVAARSDSLGRLARVFGDMAESVYQRERSLQQNIRTLKGSILLLAVGALWGLMVPLSRLISIDVPQAIGASFWIELVGGLICCGWAAAGGKFSRINSKTMAFICMWAVLQAISSILLLLTAGHLPGIVISILIALEGFAVFLFAAVMRIEESNLRRFAGLALGLCGVVVLLFARESADGFSDWVWLLAALGIPLAYGAADLLVAARHPGDLDATAGMGLLMLLASIFTLPLALTTGQFFIPTPTQGHILILLAGLLSAVCNVAFVYLIASTGAVFASQSAYAITVAGIIWSVLLLGESLTLWSLGALALIIGGLILVGTKNEAGNVEVEFRRRPRAI